MTSAYYSTIFRTPAAEVWKIVRDFNNYPVWVEGAGESEIEDGKTGDTVGAVRSVHYNGRHIRQRLLALSDVERSQTYEFCGAASLPVSGFRATLQGWFAKWLESLRTASGSAWDAESGAAFRPSQHGSGPIRRLWP